MTMAELLAVSPFPSIRPFWCTILILGPLVGHMRFGRARLEEGPREIDAPASQLVEPKPSPLCPVR
jgi:hypothetical protein